jgi:hypothetical protein
MPEQEAFKRDDYHRVYPKGIENHFWNTARNDLVYRLLKPHLDPGDLVLDVGCGTGIVVSYLRQKAINVRGVELGDAPLISGLESLISTGTDLFDLEESLKKEVKVILLLDVLEHIGQRREFLQQVFRQLPNCQFIVATVPARMELWSSYDEFWGHHLRYNRMQVEQDLQHGGWVTENCFYFFNWVYVVSLVMGKLGFKKANDFKPIENNGLARLFHGLLGAVTKLESRLVPGFVPGSSIACLASRGMVETAQVTGEVVENLHSSREGGRVHTTDMGAKK